MGDQVLASFPDPDRKGQWAEIVDDGRAGYIRFYEGVRKKEQVGLAWIYNRPKPAPGKPTEYPGNLTHDAMPASIIGKRGICASPENSRWSMIWAEPGDDDYAGCVLLQDGRPVVLEDPRTKETYCVGLAKGEAPRWGWLPFPEEMIKLVIDSILPKLKAKGDQLILPAKEADLAKHRLHLPELPHQKIQYGKPKLMGRVKLDDVIEHPIWVGMVEDDRYTEEHERPVVSQKDVDDVLLDVGHVFVAITLKAKEADLYMIGYLSDDCKSVESLVAWNGKKWMDLDEIKDLEAPLTLVALPTIEGKANVAFVCKSLKGKARRVK